MSKVTELSATEIATNESNLLKVNTLIDSHKLEFKSPLSPKFIKNTLSHANSRNQQKFALIYTGDGKYTFIGVNAEIKSVSGKLIKVTQLVIKSSNETSAHFNGDQFYIKWSTPNGLYSGGHFARNKSKWSVVKANKTGLKYADAIKLMSVNNISADNITNMVSKPKTKKAPKTTVSAPATK